jgi:hypothetical protein
MRKLVLIVLAIGLLAAPAFAAKGNDLPSGQKTLYNLQIIAYDAANCPQHDAYDTGRHQIAVKADVGSNHPDRVLASQLIRDNDILLSEGPEFRVLDGNACIDGVAEFQLPNPQVGGTLQDPTFPIYQVWLRLVGKPYTGIDVATCAIDPVDPTITTDDIVRCSVEEIELTRSKGKNSAPKFQNVSKELLTVCADTSVPADGICDIRVPLFSSTYYGYWWDWGTTGKAHAQVVFVQSPPAP